MHRTPMKKQAQLMYHWQVFTCQMAARRCLEESRCITQVLGWSIEEGGRQRSACLSQTCGCLTHEIRQPLQLCLHSIAQDLPVQTRHEMIKILSSLTSPDMTWLPWLLASQPSGDQVWPIFSGKHLKAWFQEGCNRYSAFTFSQRLRKSWKQVIHQLCLHELDQASA